MPDDLPRPLPPDRQNPLFADQRDPVADIAPGKAGWCQTRPPWALPRRGPSAPRRLHHRHHPGPDRVGQSLPALDDEGEVGRKCAAKCAALGADPLFPRGKRRLFESLVAHWPGLRNRHDSRGFRRKPSLHSGFCFSVRFPARPRGNVPLNWHTHHRLASSFQASRQARKNCRSSVFGVASNFWISSVTCSMTVSTSDRQNRSARS